MPMYWAIVLKTSLLLRGFGPLFYAVRLFGLAFRPSFSFNASTTKSMTDVSWVTQCSLSRR